MPTKTVGGRKNMGHAGNQRKNESKRPLVPGADDLYEWLRQGTLQKDRIWGGLYAQDLIQQLPW